jgi:hypothetical protein
LEQSPESARDLDSHAGAIAHGRTVQAVNTNAVAFVATNTWTEGGITWNNKPASSTVLGNYTITAGSPINLPITAQVQAAMATGKVVSIRVYSTTAPVAAGTVKYGSSEHGTASSRPILIITP